MIVLGESGQVIGVGAHTVTVQIQRTEACSRCGACTALGGGNFMVVEAKNICGAKDGDWVRVELEGDSFLKAVCIMYGVPLVFLLIGIAIGSAVAGEGVGFAAGIIFMVCSYALIKSKESYFKSKNYTPIAAEIVEPPAL